MANVYSSDFNSATAGSIAPSWANKIGAFAVSNANGVSGSKSMGSTSQGNGDVALLTGVSAIADMDVTFVQVVPALDGFGERPIVSPVVRADSGFTAGYVLLVGTNSRAQFYRRNGSGYTTIIGDAALPFTLATGDVLYLRCKIVGSTLTGYAWRNSDAVPTSAFITKTDSNVTAAGYAGVYHAPAYAAAYFDNFSLDDTTVAVPATLTAPTPASGNVGAASGNFIVALSATSANPTTCTLSDGGAGGTFTPASLVIAAGASNGTFTYTPASSGAKTISVSINNGYSLSGTPTTYTANAAAATSATLSGSSTGVVNSGTTLTVTLNGPASANVSFTFADTLAATFSANPLVITAGSSSGTVTFTPTASGNHSITMTNDGGLSQSGSPLPYTATNNGIFPVDHAGINWSPYNWDTLNVGDYGVATKSKQTTCAGAYLSFIVAGTTTLSLGVDVSTLAAFSAADTPLIYYTIDNGAMQTLQLPTSGTSVSLATGLSTASHEVKVWLMGTKQTAGTRWAVGASPTNVLRITSIIAAAGSTLTLPTVQSKRFVFFSDSIGEGVLSVGASVAEPGDHRRSAAWLIGQALGCEYGVIAYGMQGWAAMGAGSVPMFPNSWAYHNDGRARSFSPAPDYACTMFGFNGTTLATTVANWITAARAAMGANTKICIVIAPSGVGATGTIDGVNNYKAANPGDTKVYLIDNRSVIPTATYTGALAPNWLSIDGVHPNELGNAQIAAATTSNILQASLAAGSATFPTASQVLTGVSFGPNGADYTGNVTLPAANKVRSGNSFGANGTQYAGTLTLPTAAQVQSGITFGADGTEITGTVTLPTSSQVLSGVNFGAGSVTAGNVVLPATTNVRSGVQYGVAGTGSTGNVSLPTAAQVQSGVQFGSNGTQYTGTYAGGGGGGTYPAANVVLTGNTYGPNGNDYTGTVSMPSAASVLSGVTFGAAGAQTGTIALPAASAVRSGTSYGAGGTQYSGTVTLPAVGDVRAGTQYGSGGTQYTGTLSVGVADQWDSVIEGSLTARQLMRVMSAVLVGRVAGIDANAPVFRSADNSKPRVTAVTDESGNRVSITLDVS